ncbi:MAG: DUF3052 domain-containing protein [Anaerolineae bacterium]|nr:DUF3052 domain-containing protein [Anaerolineae bacterium]
MRVAILNAPDGYDRTLGTLPGGVQLLDLLADRLDFIHVFVRGRAALEADFPDLKASLAPAGMLWVSWLKKSAKIPTDLDENIVREIGLMHGLVDVKVAAVDERWSGLKFVYRLKDR